MNNINIIDSNNQLLENINNKSNFKIVIVASRFNSLIVDNLINGCVYSLNSHGIENNNIEVIKVPGAMEIPLAVQSAIKANSNIAGVVALGAVIRGATPHFDYVASECMSGLSRISLDYNIPLGNGVLTTDTIEQALERAGSKAGNKGSDAAMAMLNMLNLIDKLNTNKL